MFGVELESGNSAGVAERNLEKLRQVDEAGLSPQERVKLEALVHRWMMVGEEARRSENTRNRRNWFN